MSVVKLLKDYKGMRAGSTLPAVPFLEAKEMVAAGIAERVNQPSSIPARRGAGDEATALREKVGALTAEVDQLKADSAGAAKLKAENEKLVTEVDRLKAEVAELKTKLAAKK